MENKYLKKRKWVILGAVLLVLTLIITGTYALWNYFKVGPNQQLVAGDIYMKYTEGSSTINIQNAMPTNTYDPSQVFEFTIEGKNTYTKPIWYEIVIKWGDEPVDRHTRIPDEFLRFRLTEQLPDGEEQEVIAEGKYDNFEDGKKIWVNKIAANQTDEITITYKLYMWVSNEMHLGSGDDAETSDMDMETWNRDAFASVKVSVNGDFEEKTLEEEQETPTTVVATEMLKAKLGTDGLIGIPTTCSEESCEPITDKSADKSTIREYRYSGETVNNYVYFNCSDSTSEQNSSNCETWRIIGIFKDDSENEHMKIVRNSVSSSSMVWNSSNNPSWTSSEVNTYLNGSYLTSLTSKAQNMIYEEAKWYLGKVTYEATTVNLYTQERSTSDYNPWTGKIGLMYPSDYGYSVDSSYWTTKTGISGFTSTVVGTSWLYKTANPAGEWFLSPSSYGSNYVALWGSSGRVYYYIASVYCGVRAAIYLKSTVQITGNNDGSLTAPYTLIS